MIGIGELPYCSSWNPHSVSGSFRGSSGVQTIGAITPFTKKVSIFARSPFWISPPFDAEAAGEGRDWKMGNFACEEATRRFKKFLRGAVLNDHS